jgi:hypothetical protein
MSLYWCLTISASSSHSKHHYVALRSCTHFVFSLYVTARTFFSKILSMHPRISIIKFLPSATVHQPTFRYCIASSFFDNVFLPVHGLYVQMCVRLQVRSETAAGVTQSSSIAITSSDVTDAAHNQECHMDDHHRQRMPDIVTSQAS